MLYIIFFSMRQSPKVRRVRSTALAPPPIPTSSAITLEVTDSPTCHTQACACDRRRSFCDLRGPESSTVPGPFMDLAG